MVDQSKLSIVVEFCAVEEATRALRRLRREAAATRAELEALRPLLAEVRAAGDGGAQT